MSVSEDAAKAKKSMLHVPAQRVLTDKDFVSTGLTLLNKATYGRVFGGMAKGFIYRIIGRSGTAKSFLCRNILAEAANNPNFDDYDLIHDDIEKGVIFINTAKFFGETLAKRITAPAYGKNSRKPIYSETIMDLYARLSKRLDAGKKFIWLVDSQDALKAMTVTKMGDGKAKIHANELRQINDDRLIDSGSIIIIVQHAKANMSQDFSWAPKADVTTGGASLEFYSTLDIRLSKNELIRKIVRKKGDREIKLSIGNWFSAHTVKNRLTGMDRSIRFPFYNSYGIDDLGSCIEYLLHMEHWKKDKNGIFQAEELDFEGTTKKLIQQVEAKSQEQELRILTGRIWDQIEAAAVIKRKPRYT